MSETIELIELPRNTVNNSAVSAMLACAYKFYLTQVRKFKQRGSSALVLGSAFHVGQEFANGVMLRGEDRPSPERIADMCRGAIPVEIAKSQKRTGVEIEWKEHDDGTTDTAERLKDDVARMTVTYENEHGRNLQPVFAEREFVLRFEGTEWVFNGRIDVATKSGVIIDYKTSGQKKGEITGYVDVQLTDYHIAVDNGDDEVQSLVPAVTALEQHVVIRPSPKFPDGRVQVLRVPPRSREQMAARLQNIATVVAQVRAGYFPRCDNWLLCSWCGFLETCNPEWYAANKDIKARAKAAAEAEKAEKAAKGKPAAACG
jgi:hypothetical protein